MSRITGIIGVSLGALGACSMSGALSSNDVLTGDWGGVHAGLTLTAERGTISYDCAHGGLQGPIRPRRAGDFDAAGVHIPEHGGPVRIDEVPDSLPARYLGQVTGDRMTLRVVVGADTLGPFDLRRGAAPQLFRCL